MAGFLSGWLGCSDPPEFSLATPRLLLRLPQMDDHASWLALRRASRVFLEPWEPTWRESDFTPAAFRQRVRRCRALARADEAYRYFIFGRQDNVLVGGVSLFNVRRGDADAASLGYWIGQPFARQGFMTEAVRAILDHGFGTLRLHRIEAACLPHNEASMRLLARCGFEREGYARAYLKIAGRWQDHVLFAHLAGSSSSFPRPARN